MRILLNNFCEKKRFFECLKNKIVLQLKKHSHLPNHSILLLLTTKTCLSIKNKNVCTIKNCSVKSLEIIFCVILMSISCFSQLIIFASNFLDVIFLFTLLLLLLPTLNNTANKLFNVRECAMM